MSFRANELIMADRRRTLEPMSIRILALLALACAILPGAAGAENPVLVATVGPGFTIGLADANGKPVDVVTAGHYTLVVHDLSAEQNFVLANKPDGLRLRVETTVEFVGDKSFDIDLAEGRYGYACSPHWQVMNGSLTAIEPTGTPTRRR